MDLELESTIETVVSKYPQRSKKAKEGNRKQLIKLVNSISNATFKTYDDGKITEELELYLSQKYSLCSKIAGCPVKKEEKRLAFKNPKTNTIHVASESPYESTDSKLPASYTWSVCNFGSVRGKKEENSIYLTEDELQNEYITKDGKTIGKLCGNCKQKFT